MAANKIIAIQEALLHKGFAPGEVDGAWGRRTIAAVKTFQRSVGLTPDGIVGPLTEKALFPTVNAQPANPLLPWMAEADNLLGTKEILGARSNPLILDWASSLDLHYPGDDIPWCGLFVAHCIGSTLPEEILPPNPLGARQWERFGDPTVPRLGAIMVFWRESRESGKGHVGLYTGEDEHAYRILGGNQNDKVCLAWVGRDRLTKARWPRSAAGLVGGQTVLVRDRQAELAATEA
jgi:uncharacterized protein (TIGR02594 family)